MDHSLKTEAEEGPSKDLQQIQNMSEASPKRLKQTDILSPKKQTATDSESGGSSKDSDTVQKQMDHSFKKEVEEGSSKHLQQKAEEEKHTFLFCLNSETYSVVCYTSMTVLEALNTSQSFRNETVKNNIQKEIIIQRSNGPGPRAAVKTDFPCCLIERDEVVYLTFIKNEGTSSTNQQSTAGSLREARKPEMLVTFWVKKDGGQKVLHLLKSKALRSKVQYVCVYAFKGEKIKTALKRDGRFINDIFLKHCALSEFSCEHDREIKHELSILVDDLAGRAFQIVVVSDKNQPDSQDDLTLVKTEPNVASDADVAETVGSSLLTSNASKPIKPEQEKKQDGSTKFTNPSSKRYVAKPIVNSQEFLAILRAQFDDLLVTLKQRENLKNKSEVQKFFRAEYDKSVQSFSEVKKVKQLMRLSDSVCQIRVEGSARGTGFLLFDRFVLTNAHVIGEFDPFTRKLSKTFTAVFGYEDLEAKETKCVPVKEHVAAYYYGKINMDRYLDFALLELKDADEIADCPGLLSRYTHAPPPNRGGICIVGHPGEGVKKMDPCFIIGKENRQEAADKHISENVNLIHVMTQQSLAEKWEMHDNQISYNSCFFHGSSGSPVFDEDCYLIGVHTGGYAYKGETSKTRSIMEYAYSMQPILESIFTQAKKSERSDILKLL